MKIRLFGTLVALGAVVAALSPSTAQAATVTGLTFEDVSGGGGADITGVTIVEFNVFDSGTIGSGSGTTWNPDSTLTIPTNARFSDGTQGDDGTYWRRTGGVANWTSFGGTDRRYRGESGNITPAVDDNDGIAQLVSTVEGLDAGKTYAFYFIANARSGSGAGVGGSTTYLADFGTALATSSKTEVLRELHVKDLNDVVTDNDLGFYGLTIGNNTGSTSYSVSLESGDGSYWIGVGYHEIVPEPTSVALLVTGLIGVCSLRRRKRCYVKA